MYSLQLRIPAIELMRILNLNSELNRLIVGLIRRSPPWTTNHPVKPPAPARTKFRIELCTHSAIESSRGMSLPLIDISSLVDDAASTEARSTCAAQINSACRQFGFFRISGHGVPAAMQTELEALSHQFFKLPEQEKIKIEMAKAGSAWRGFFPVGDELTSGKPDLKEGIYFGDELPADHPRVVSGTPLHGQNQYPAAVPALQPAVEAWMSAMRRLGSALLRGVSLALGMPVDWFEHNICQSPTHLFRIFHYPPTDGVGWGVGEHTDYGVLTLLAQDHCGGLQVKLLDGKWIDVPAEPNVFIVNLGDMLEKLTEGRYRSTPHRVRNVSGLERLSFPFFVDPSWDATVTALPLDGAPPADDQHRWDASSVRAWQGVYGDYLTAKVSRVFPKLFSRVAEDSSSSS